MAKLGARKRALFDWLPPHRLALLGLPNKAVAREAGNGVSSRSPELASHLPPPRFIEEEQEQLGPDR